MSRIAALTPVAAMKSRRARELAGIRRRIEKIAETANGLDQIDAEFLSQAADENLDGVGIAVEVLIVEVLNKLGAGNDAAHMMHEIGEQPVFVRGETDGVAVDGDAPGAGIEMDRATVQLAGGVPARPAKQRA